MRGKESSMGVRHFRVATAAGLTLALLTVAFVGVPTNVAAVFGSVTFSENFYEVGETISVRVLGGGDYYDGFFRFVLTDALGAAKKAAQFDPPIMDGEIDEIVTYVVNEADAGGRWMAHLIYYDPITHQSTSLGTDQAMVMLDGQVEILSSKYPLGSTMYISVSGVCGATDGQFEFRLKDPDQVVRLSKVYPGIISFNEIASFPIGTSEKQGIWTVQLDWYSNVWLYSVYLDFDSAEVYKDTDGDGLSDAYEQTTYYPIVDPGLLHYTSVTNPDSDGDGLTDGTEVNTYHTNPLMKDTDSDGLGDYAEIFTYGTYPNDSDTDNDDLQDGAEVNTYGTNPLDPTTDGDGWTDGDEVFTYHTDPTLTSTDSDGVADDLDMNPLIDLEVRFYMFEINQLDKLDKRSLTDGDMKWVVYAYATGWVDSIESPIYKDSGHLELGTNFYYTFNVPDNQPQVSFTVILYDDDGKNGLTVCDIAKGADLAAYVEYDLTTGDWSGADTICDTNGDFFDDSYNLGLDYNGPGHVSGTEGGSGDTTNVDCELWFYIWQNDNDLDGFTYQEDSDPVSCYSGDYDGDGAIGYIEYQSLSKPDYKDTDGDTIWDGFEIVSDGLSPIYAPDGDALRGDLGRIFEYCGDSSMGFSDQFSYSHLCTHKFSTDIGFDGLVTEYIYERTPEVELMLMAVDVLCQGLGMGIVSTVAYMFVEWLENLFTEFGQFELNWLGWDADDYLIPVFGVQPAGVVHQVNAGCGFDDSELISTRLSSLVPIYATMKSLATTKSNNNFEGLVNLASAALDVFGPISTATAQIQMPITGEDGTVEWRDVFDPNDPVMSEYSELEYAVYQFMNRLVTVSWYWHSTVDLVPYSDPDITVGEVAQDLVNVAYNLLGLLRAERLLLQGLVECDQTS